MPRRISHARRAMPLIITAGCLVMPYVTVTTGAVFTDFMRALGAREVHFGLLSGIPMSMLSLQFLGAFLANSMRSRKVLFMILAITGRLLYLPVAFLPVLLPDVSRDTLIPLLIVTVAVSAGISNMIGPPWFSWMADLIPSEILSRFWGQRQKYMHLVSSICQFAVMVAAVVTKSSALVFFPVLISIAVPAAVVDVLLFIRVHEPPNTIVRGRPVLQTILAPLRRPDYRSFVLFCCAWSAAGMFSATFTQIYALKVLGLSIGQTVFIWCFLGFGVALSSGFWGRLVDEHGHRPIFVFAMFVKPLIIGVFLLLTPGAALWALCPAFLIDSIWNAAMMVAIDGYMLKFAPTEDRPMYVAALTGLAGICGGLGAMAGGYFLEATAGFSVAFLGRTWNHYQLLFLVGIFLRMACFALARRVREPTSSTPAKLVRALHRVWPMRLILFPIGFYRLLTGRSWREESTGEDGVI
ncbi:MAG: MFS transporter [Verrucomicrobiota bacterium]|nr:MFS transporter [Verrucomicrobiota bacterium]